jgi:hypothetical protein
MFLMGMEKKVLIAILIALTLLTLYFFQGDADLSPVVSAESCARQGERFDVNDDSLSNQCCSGLRNVEASKGVSIGLDCFWTEPEYSQDKSKGVCSSCGNGICESVESACGCAIDCQDQAEFETREEFCELGFNKYRRVCDNADPRLEFSLCDIC